MPVRIYDISKKLGLENKEVLSKAKELGIAAARVASSSLDKITAEYLEQQLVQAYPDRISAPAATPAAAIPAAENEKIEVITAPPPETEAARERESETATAVMEPPEAPVAEGQSSGAIAPERPHAPRETEFVSKTPPPPPEPVGPKVGDKIG